MTSLFMPFRGERGAPVFDRTRPSSSIRRYFVQLEMLFARCSIADDLEKKTHITPYLDCDLADNWEALCEFSDATKTYADFKSRLFDLYNQNVPRYSIFDLERLALDQFRSGLQTLQTLSEYHLRFNAISTHLLGHDLLSPREQSQMYLRAFDASLHTAINFRLQIQYPDHHPSHPYSIDMIFEAARWILRAPTIQSTIPTVLTPAIAISTTPLTPVPPSSNVDFVKTEHLNAILSTVSQIVAAAVSSSDVIQTTSKSPSCTVPVSTKTIHAAASKSTIATSIAHTPAASTTIAAISLTTMPTVPTTSPYTVHGQGQGVRARGDHLWPDRVDPGSAWPDAISSTLTMLSSSYAN